ncbi:MAG: hypothetical protein JWR50_723 [Mucilaginibacter sp.]|nr:hypothetical protein [Mucilaginibacter sp.]
MKNIRSWSIMLVTSCILFACSSNGSASAGNGGASNATSDNSGGGSSNGNGSFSYTIDGNKVDVKSLYINGVKNLAGGRLKIEVTNTPTSEVFNFSIANTGITTVLHYSPSLSNYTDKKSNEAEYMSHKYKNYYGDSVTITITSIDATHVAGTFSGEYLSDDKKPVPLEITDGSFDLPFTKDRDKVN